MPSPGHKYDHSDQEGLFGPPVPADTLDLPVTISNPAHNALAYAGIARLDDLDGLDREAVANLHGMGPKALRLLEEAMAEHGLGFAGEPPDSPGGTGEHLTHASRAGTGWTG